MSEKLYSLPSSWQLFMAPNAEVKQKKFEPTTVSELASEYASIPASVPGCFELDLVNAGLAPDPYFSQNPWSFQQYENRHLWYATDFDWEGDVTENTFFRFEGIDTVADIYVNGVLLGSVDNMLISHEFSADGFLKKGKNQIVVHIHPVTIYSRKYEVTAANTAQKYNLSSIHIRKAAYMYGWDIMPRFVSGGIWKPVSIVTKPAARLKQAYLCTNHLSSDNAKATLRFFFEAHIEEDDLSEYSIALDAKCGDSEFSINGRLWHTYGNIRKTISNPVLWYPKRAGEQKMYDVTVRLLKNGEVCDEKTFRHGIRTVELIRSSTTDADGNGEFVFKVNGKKVFCLGTNWVPLDAFPSRHNLYLARGLEMLDDLGCNMVRCWGGNVYERDEFYDFCDERGILVWQDFGMGCAVYPLTDDFANRLYKEATHVIKRLRQHPCLALWAGDNENDIVYGRTKDPNKNFLTREVLPKALLEHDTVLPYIPSSPYVDEEAFATQKPKSEDHLWGPRDYFKGNFYKNSVCHFASETGYHGCPSPTSLKKFLAPNAVWPIFDKDGVPNDDWVCHAAEMTAGTGGPYAYRIRLMASQVETLFGEASKNLDDFAKQSQISQAEAKKYFIERFRLSKWRRTGILWWNLIDGWPQISDAIVDHYGTKKLAYSYIKRSQAPVCMMFDEPDENGLLKLFAVNDTTSDEKLKYTVTNIRNGQILATGEVCALADSSVAVTDIENIQDAFLYIEWENDSGVVGCNHFSTKTLDISYEQYMADIKKVGFDQFEGF